MLDAFVAFDDRTHLVNSFEREAVVGQVQTENEKKICKEKKRKKK